MEGEEEKPVDKFTPKQTRFVEEYTIDFNATAASIRAGYSVHTAAVIGYENLMKPHIKKAIDARVERLSMTANEAMIRMADFARGNFRPFMHVDENGIMTMILTSEEALSNLHLIKRIKQKQMTLAPGMTEVTTEIELHDAKDAVKAILQMHGKLIDKKAIDITSNGQTIKPTIIKFGDGSNGTKGSNT